MLKRSKITDITPDAACMETDSMPGIFLRLHSPRRQTALPYASLARIELSLNEGTIDLTFVGYRIRICGKKLGRIYLAVASAEAREIRCVSEYDVLSSATYPSLCVVEQIHVEECN